jgi:hypothetical protein
MIIIIINNVMRLIVIPAVVLYAMILSFLAIPLMISTKYKEAGWFYLGIILYCQFIWQQHAIY